jgi:hypothetical protein
LKSLPATVIVGQSEMKLKIYTHKAQWGVFQNPKGPDYQIPNSLVVWLLSRLDHESIASYLDLEPIKAKSYNVTVNNFDVRSLRL